MNLAGFELPQLVQSTSRYAAATRYGIVGERRLLEDLPAVSVIARWQGITQQEFEEQLSLKRKKYSWRNRAQIVATY